MNYTTDKKNDNTYHITGIGLFDCDVVFDCGQCFRWYKQDEYWNGIAGSKIAKVKTINDGIELICEEEDFDYWMHYLDIDYDYISARNKLMQDKDIAPLIGLSPGIRFLNQDFFECLISFIISANNNIKRIKGIIERICTTYGDKVGEQYSFPTAEVLAQCTEDDFKSLGAGYRAGYILETARLYVSGYDHTPLYTRDIQSARKELTYFKGVGIKVADCVLLFSLMRKDAFPVDTWIRKVMHALYNDKSLSDNQIRQIAEDRFAGNAGLANQYLFHINRTMPELS